MSKKIQKRNKSVVIIGAGYIANEYAMSFQMDSTANRGFWWGKNTHSDAQGGMALTSDGKLNVAKSISIGEGETTTSPSTTPLYVLGQTNGETVLDIQGTNGQLFSITDNLEGSLLAVSDISGIPVLDVKASGEVRGTAGWKKERGTNGAKCKKMHHQKLTHP